MTFSAAMGYLALRIVRARLVSPSAVVNRNSIVRCCPVVYTKHKICIYCNAEFLKCKSFCNQFAIRKVE